MPLSNASRNAARLSTAGAALFALVTSACAHGPEPTFADVKRDLGQLAKASPAERLPAVDVKRPQSRVEARGMLERAFEASADGQHGIAVALYGAVLGTDYLTDRGRANLYWMRAESYGELRDDEGRRDALLGFLVASDVAPPDDELRARRLLARSEIAAMRLEEDPRFGRSPDEPISVEDLREPASIMSTLNCGPARDAHYVDVAIRSVRRDESRLLQRRAECQGDGAVLELWFDVTHAEKAKQ